MSRIVVWSDNYTASVELKRAPSGYGWEMRRGLNGPDLLAEERARFITADAIEFAETYVERIAREES